MNKMFSNFRARMDEAEISRATRHLDNHLLRDIGLPPRPKQPTIGHF